MDDRRWRIVGAVVLAAAVSVGAAMGFFSGADPVPAEFVDSEAALPGSTGPASPVSQVVVHVAGAVAHPGLVTLPPDSRVADAVAAAGGMTDAAVDTGINLAAPVSDGGQVIVPSSVAGPGAPPVVDDGLVHVNQADAIDLERLPGVGPVLAERIVAHRDANGPFTAVEDLLDVPGIGEAKLAALRDLLALP